MKLWRAIQGISGLGREVVPKRAYQCRACNGWHVTSKDSWNGEGNIKPKDRFERYLDRKVREKFDGLFSSEVPRPQRDERVV